MWIPGREKTGTKRYKSDNKVGKSPSKSSSEASREAKGETRVEILIHTQEHPFILMIHIESAQNICCYIMWQSPKQKRLRNEKLREWCVCVCVEENITEHEVTEAKGLGQGGDTRPESTRPKPHTHTQNLSKNKSFMSVCELQHHRKECFLP